MNCYAILAVRPFEDGKSRLADTLDFENRKKLNLNMFRHVVSTIYELLPPANVIVVSRSPTLLDEARHDGAHGIAERGEGLNQALTQGGEAALQMGAASLLSVSSDLPLLRVDDLAAMLAEESDVVIATDRECVGTNAMLVRPPLAIPYLYGNNSLAAHRAAAAKHHLNTTIIHRPGLAHDLDTPSDLSDYLDLRV